MTKRDDGSVAFGEAVAYTLLWIVVGGASLLAGGAAVCLVEWWGGKR